MTKKIIVIFTLFAFIVFSISCYTTSTRDIKTVADSPVKKGKILGVVKTSGEYIEFSKENPGQISGDKIIGTVIRLEKKEIKINRANILKMKKTRKHFIITTKEGIIHQVDIGGAKMEEDKMVFISTLKSTETVSIPLSEVESLRIKKVDAALTAVAVIATVAGVGLGVLLIVLTSIEW